MRILFVIRSLVVGGAERQCIELAARLKQRGHEVTLCTMSDSGPFEPVLRAHGLTHHRLGHRGPRDFVRSGWRLRAAARALRPDVVYSFMSVSNLLCAISLPPEIRLHLVWGVRASWMDLPAYGWFPRMVLRLERVFARRPRLIIANSEAGAAYQKAMGFPEAAIRVVENTIDTELFRWDPDARRHLRAALQVPDNRRVVVIVARIDPIKGYDTFLAAASSVAATSDDVEFWSVGGGDEALKASLDNKARAMGIASRLRWMGEVRDGAELVSILNASDLAVSASLAEGFPNSVAEALACGLRVVGTDVGDTCRMIGSLGVCVPPRDADAMSAALIGELALTGPREEVRRDYLARFDPLMLLERHEQLLALVARVGA